MPETSHTPMVTMTINEYNELFKYKEQAFLLKRERYLRIYESLSYLPSHGFLVEKATENSFMEFILKYLEGKDKEIKFLQSENFTLNNTIKMHQLKGK